MIRNIMGGNDVPVVQCINPTEDKWMVLWGGVYREPSYTYAAEIFDHKPTIEEIKDAVFKWYNNDTQNTILTGFTWKNIPVWLSVENQLNYSNIYMLAKNTSDYLPTVKLGTEESPVYYKFQSLEEIEDFYLRMVKFIDETVSEGWRNKENFNFEKYSKILKKCTI